MPSLFVSHVYLDTFWVLEMLGVAGPVPQLSSNDFEEIVEVFRILKRIRDTGK